MMLRRYLAFFLEGSSFSKFNQGRPFEINGCRRLIMKIESSFC